MTVLIDSGAVLQYSQLTTVTIQNATNFINSFGLFFTYMLTMLAIYMLILFIIESAFDVARLAVNYLFSSFK